MPQIQEVMREMDEMDAPEMIAAREHREKMEAEPENDWSQDTEAKLRQYLASQPRNGADRSADSMPWNARKSSQSHDTTPDN